MWESFCMDGFSGGFPSFNPNEWNHIPKITGKFSPTLKSRSQFLFLSVSVCLSLKNTLPSPKAPEVLDSLIPNQ